MMHAYVYSYIHQLCTVVLTAAYHNSLLLLPLCTTSRRPFLSAHLAVVASTIHMVPGLPTVAATATTLLYTVDIVSQIVQRRRVLTLFSILLT